MECQRLKSPSKVTEDFFAYIAGLKSGLHSKLFRAAAAFVILATDRDGGPTSVGEHEIVYEKIAKRIKSQPKKEPSPEENGS